MDIVERVEKVLHFEPVDRLPRIEWAWWWNQTTDRWHKEGLAASLQESAEIRESLGMDCYEQFWASARAASCPPPAAEGAGILTDESDYERLKPHLFPRPLPFLEDLKRWAPHYQQRQRTIWGWIEGFFWFPRTLFGIERHLLAFYDQPALIHRMNQDLLEYNLWLLDEICAWCKPPFILFAEDLSYNHGPMLSKKQFDAFMAPYYRQIVPAVKKRGIIPLIDTDGDVTSLIPWFMEVGIEGVGPLERMAGVDVVQIRQAYPELKMIGGFDKTVMHRGETAIHQEFQRLLPVMRQGGYLICPDHQNPPEVSFADYQVYLKILEAYTYKAAH